MVAKEQDLDTKLAELLAGGPGGLQRSSWFESWFMHCFGGQHLRGLGEEDWGLKRSFGFGEKELSCGTPFTG